MDKQLTATSIEWVGLCSGCKEELSTSAVYRQQGEAVSPTYQSSARIVLIESLFNDGNAAMASRRLVSQLRRSCSI